MRRSIIAPILYLKAFADKIESRDYSDKIVWHRKDEIGNLADSLGLMQKSILENISEITKAKNNLHITLNSIGDAVISTDVKGNILQMNPVAENLTGWKFEEVKNIPFTKIFNIVSSKTQEVLENPVEKVLKTGKIVGLANHTALIAKNGKKYQIADSGAPMLDETGKIIGVVLVFRDVTKEYRLRERLRELARHM